MEFKVTQNQVNKIREWDKCAGLYHGAIDGHLRYIFILTSIGTIVRVECSNCGEHFEDYEQM